MVHHEMLCSRKIHKSVVVFVGVSRCNEWTGKPLLKAIVGICAFVAEEIDVGVSDNGFWFRCFEELRCEVVGI